MVGLAGAGKPGIRAEARNTIRRLVSPRPPSPAPLLPAPPSGPAPRPGAVAAGRHAIPSGVWALGFVSLFMDLSSEVYHSLLPVFLVTTLGASTISLGLIEGVAEATASITKAFSGAISDAIGRRKPLLLAGYGLAALTKPLFPLATAASWVFGARFLDRVGKGLRGAPATP